ncbi:MAG TPA: nuclear transport factor 2 family protein [Candidatus Binataceae bacterium]|jgi:ketosteroid isomerase-like protein|nr:nuclear transport factor 2 family protein [Candidatus Binataceae bacterium]
MSVESNKQLVTDFWKAFAGGDIKTAFAMLSDEVSWLIPGNLPELSGLRKGKAEILNFARTAAKTFPSGLRSEIRRVYGDGETVLVEMTNRGKLFNGRDYENEYCFVFEIEGGKIRRVREYVDTHKVHELSASA